MAVTLEWGDWLALGLYFVLVIVIGVASTCFANTGTSDGYFLAGRSSNWLLVGASTFATNIGAPMYIGLAGSAAATGIAVVMFEWHAMLMLVALGWIFLPVYRACGCSTMPQYLQLRYGGKRIQLVLSIVFILNTVIAQISGQMYAGALFIQQIFEWNLYLSVGIILLVTAAYTVVGGLTAVMWTDAIQTVILIIGSIILGVIALTRVGGFESMRERYMYAASNETLLDQALYDNHSCGMPASNAFHIFRAADDGSYPWPGLIFGLTILATNAWCTSQICVQRSLSAKSVTHAKAGALMAAYLKILPFFFFVIPGMISRVLFPDEVACSSPSECQRVCNNRFGCSNIAYPLLVANILPNGLKGLMLAGLLSALMSSLTSLYNSAATVFTLDVYRRIRSKAKENELMVVGRLFGLFMVAMSIAWLPILEAVQGSNFWDYTQSIYSHMLPPIVMTFWLGLFWKRATEQGSFWSIIICTAVGFSRMILTWVKQAPPCGSTEEDTRWPIIYKVHYLHFAMILGSIAVVLQVIISLLTKPRSDAKLRRVTFWTRADPQPQEISDDEFEETEDEPVDELLYKDEGKVKKWLKHYICGVESVRQKPKNKAQYMELQQKMTSIYENQTTKKMLDVNAVICVAACVFLHAFWY